MPTSNDDNHDNKKPSREQQQDALLAALERMPKAVASAPSKPSSSDHVTRPLALTSSDQPSSSPSRPSRPPRPQQQQNQRTPKSVYPSRHSSSQLISSSMTPTPSSSTIARRVKPSHSNFQSYQSSTMSRRNSTYQSFSLPRVEPLDPVARVDVQETVERATGLGMSTNKSAVSIANRAAAIERLLDWMRTGSIDATSVFRMIVAGTDINNPSFNIRVLCVIHSLCIFGGPNILSGALHATHPRRPTPALRVILDVLRVHSTLSSMTNDVNQHNVMNNGGVVEIEDIIHDDLHIQKHRLNQQGIIPSLSNSFQSKSSQSLQIAVELYALALARKFVFHQRFLDIEVNYSLDRFYRAMHFENYYDDERHQRLEQNEERHAVIISNATFSDVSLIAMASTSAAYALDKSRADRDAITFALAEAVNSTAFARYLAMKLNIANDMQDYNLDSEIIWLQHKTLTHTSNNVFDPRLFRKLVDQNVLTWLAAPTDQKPCRPESRHRRDIPVRLSSFRALHYAYKPRSLLSSRTHSYR